MKSAASTSRLEVKDRIKFLKVVKDDSSGDRSKKDLSPMCKYYE